MAGDENGEGEGRERGMRRRAKGSSCLWAKVGYG